MLKTSLRQAVRQLCANCGEMFNPIEARRRAKQGSAKTEPLLARTQGVLGMLNVMPPGDGMREHAVKQLLQLKLDWQAVTPVD